MRCKCCKKRKMTIECKWCKEEYCTKCIQVEVHECTNIKECINYKKEKLENSLKKIKKEQVLKI